MQERLEPRLLIALCAKSLHVAWMRNGERSITSHARWRWRSGSWGEPVEAGIERARPHMEPNCPKLDVMSSASRQGAARNPSSASALKCDQAPQMEGRDASKVHASTSPTVQRISIIAERIKSNRDARERAGPVRLRAGGSTQEPSGAWRRPL